MTVDRSLYPGREQAYVKHYLLDGYLDDAFHKVASRFDEVVYVDGFSGPWQAKGTNFADTSFGIALAALRRAKATWKEKGRDVRVTAHLVETRSEAYRELQQLQPRFPEVIIRPRHANFVDVAGEIAASISSSAFAFLFIDPKGWRIDMRRIAPLLQLSNCEVLFNFMFEFINRAASIDDPEISAGLDQLMLDKGWRAALAETDNPSPSVRKQILIDGFAAALASAGKFDFVAETPVFRPMRNRTLYSLFFGTRKAKGIEVFRSHQVKTFKCQNEVRAEAKLSASVTATGQIEAFDFREMAPDQSATLLSEQLSLARSTMLAAVPIAPKWIDYGRLWPAVLGKHVVTKPQVNRLIVSAEREGLVRIEGWSGGKKVPDDHYRISRVT